MEDKKIIRCVYHGPKDAKIIPYVEIDDLIDDDFEKTVKYKLKNDRFVSHEIVCMDEEKGLMKKDVTLELVQITLIYLNICNIHNIISAILKEWNICTVNKIINYFGYNNTFVDYTEFELEEDVKSAITEMAVGLYNADGMDKKTLTDLSKIDTVVSNENMNL